MIFSGSSPAPLSHTLPAFLHGDEGRGLKHSGIMCLSLQGVIGRGTSKSVRKHALKQMGINMLGNSFNTRFLIAAMPKKIYEKKNEVYLSLVDAVVDDLLILQNNGFVWQNERWYIQVLGLKGDMPYLTQTASLERHYLRMARKEVTRVARDPPGMCFLCEAGKRDIPLRTLTTMLLGQTLRAHPLGQENHPF